MPAMPNLNMRRWNGLALGILVAAMMHLTTTNAIRVDEPWPMLLSGESMGIDPSLALLQQRAAGSLDRLVQSAHGAHEPL